MAEPEIVEWSWLCFDLVSKTITDSKQVFVRPQAAASSLQEALPGASDDDLEAAVTLSEAVRLFDNYVYTKFMAHNKSFSFMVCNDVDLAHLRQECASKGVKLAAHYSMFIHLGAHFSKAFKAPAPTDSTGMLVQLELVVT